MHQTQIQEVRSFLHLVRICLLYTSGIKYLELTVKNNQVSSVKVNMGSPILNAKTIPVVSEKEQVINEPLIVNGKTYHITAVSMGNPHALSLIHIWHFRKLS